MASRRVNPYICKINHKGIDRIQVPARNYQPAAVFRAK